MGSRPISSKTVEMLRNFSTIWRTFPGLQLRTSRITYMTSLLSHRRSSVELHTSRGSHDPAEILVRHEIGQRNGAGYRRQKGGGGVLVAMERAKGSPGLGRSGLECSQLTGELVHRSNAFVARRLVSRPSSF